VLRVCEAHYKGVVGILPWQGCLLFCLWLVSLFTAFGTICGINKASPKRKLLRGLTTLHMGEVRQHFSFPLPKVSPSDAPLNQHAVSTVHYEGWMMMVSCQQTRFC
jgi:hypothetical protein